MLLGLRQQTERQAFGSCEVLTNAQMRAADALAIEGGATDYDLMMAAGQAIANTVQAHYPAHDILILCGPGNNGGDGFAAAMFLKAMNRTVTVMSLVPGWRLRGDAKKAYKNWGGKALDFKERPDMAVQTVVVDAVFGTGFSKHLEPPVTDVFKAVKESGWPVVAADIPSGVNGDTGEADPHTLAAAHTVTFFRKKIGHLLIPGLSLCGDVSVHDIGIQGSVLEKTGFALYENAPSLWQEKLPGPESAAHKYSRGHLVVLGGVRMTGAARMASEAAMRMGAGLCTVAAMQEAALVYQRAAPHVLYEPLHSFKDFRVHLKDERRNAILMGPGAGLEDQEGLRRAVLDVLATGRPCLLDADALTCFADDPFLLRHSLHAQCVLTPHEGEFTKIFPDAAGGKFDRAMAVARYIPAVLLLKGPDTVIVQKGRVPVVNVHATPWLATAGAGDVLAGMIAGLLAQHMGAFDAACAAAWIHGEAAARKGPGLVAPDIIEQTPGVLRDFALPP